MKNRTVITILGIILAVSVCGNILLARNWTDARGQVAVFSNRVVTADEQITTLQEQVSAIEDLQNEISTLQSQLTDSNNQIESLETSLSESETQIQDLKNEIAEKEATIEGLMAQSRVEEPKQETRQPVQTSTPVNTMPGPLFGDLYDGTPAIGDGSGAGIMRLE